MPEINCLICNALFISERCSKLCCGPICERIRKQSYDANRYYEFRSLRRKRRREMLVEKYSILSHNARKIDAVCDGCLNKFYWDYNLYQSFDNTHVNFYNTTNDGIGYCPNCGLVIENSTKEIEFNHNFKYINQAIYCRNGRLDFIREAEKVRSMRNAVSYIGELTVAEIDLCIKALVKE